MTMMRARKSISGLFAIVLVLAAQAGAVPGCQLEASLAAVSAASDADAHAHQYAKTLLHDRQGMDHSKHLNSSGDMAGHGSSVECPCSGTCASMCALSSGSPIVLSVAIELIPVGTGIQRSPKEDAFRAGPTPHAPYRPPISLHS